MVDLYMFDANMKDIRLEKQEICSDLIKFDVFCNFYFGFVSLTLIFSALEYGRMDVWYIKRKNNVSTLIYKTLNYYFLYPKPFNSLNM